MELSNIPEELVQEILLRSPVKSLLRFKCVCKSWLSLICDPSFAKSHFELSAAPSHRLLFKEEFYTYEALHVDESFHDDSAVVSVIHPPLPESDDFVRVYAMLGSCRGFILVMGESSRLYIWNPSIGVHRHIPLPDNICTQNHFLIGFGYDPFTDDYLVVGLWFVGEGTLMDIFLFSLRTNSWEKIQHSLTRKLKFPRHEDGLFFNGAIHWLVFPGIERPMIIVFDLFEKQLSEISLPDIGDFKNHSFGDLLIMDGCLSVWYHHWGLDKNQVWMMKEYKVQSSWTMFDIPDRNFSHIWSTKGGGELLALSVGDDKLTKLNDQGELLGIFRISYAMTWLKPALYTESLLSLP